jgi:hypothetical protein
MADMKLRFSIRDWMWLAALVALAVVLFLEHLEIRRLSAAVEDMRYWAISAGKATADHVARHPESITK